MSKRENYSTRLHLLQIELVKLQRHFIDRGDRILVMLEGRDAARKDGSIKRIAEQLNPRETRVVALGKPSDRERSAWYFQRYVAHLPVAGDTDVDRLPPIGEMSTQNVWGKPTSCWERFVSRRKCYARRIFVTRRMTGVRSPV